MGVSSDLLKVNLAIAGYPLVYQEHAFPIDELGFAASLIEAPLTANERFWSKQPTEEAIQSMNILHHVDQWTPPMFLAYDGRRLSRCGTLVEAGGQIREAPFELHIFEKANTDWH